MDTLKYEELPEEMQKLEFARQLEFHLDLLPIEYEYAKKSEAEDIALTSCKNYEYVNFCGVYYRIEFNQIQ